MVEITEPGLVKRLIQILGLRGRPIVSARNSVYPVIVANQPTEQVPVMTPTVPNRLDVRVITVSVLRNAATTTEYTVPSGKKFNIMFFGGTTAAGGNLDIKNAATATRLKLFNSGGVDSYALSLSTPLVMDAGDYLESNAGAGNCTFEVYGYEEDV